MSVENQRRGKQVWHVFSRSKYRVFFHRIWRHDRSSLLALCRLRRVLDGYQLRYVSVSSDL